ncbi:MAG: hypothetical protein GDA36_09095 [Rhodobacteraceae bacterium]|nr:hypothetical protein [Paracoccaceae bacterium]
MLDGDKAFKRWNIIKFNYGLPTHDRRTESCRVYEDSIKVEGQVKKTLEKSELVARALVESEQQAISRKQSLALIRPSDVEFSWERLSKAELVEDKRKFAKQAAQLPLLETEIAAYQPCPFRFKMKYRDGDGPHTKTCADWETSATFVNLRQKRGMEERAVLQHLQKTYCEDYTKTGLVLAIGNMQKRPQTWQLLGIFPVRGTTQSDLFVA